MAAAVGKQSASHAPLPPRLLFYFISVCMCLSEEEASGYIRNSFPTCWGSLGKKKMTEHLLPPHLPVFIARLLFFLRGELEDNCRKRESHWGCHLAQCFSTDNHILYNYIWQFSRILTLLITQGESQQTVQLRVSLWLILDWPKMPPVPELAVARLLLSQRKEEPNAAGV